MLSIWIVVVISLCTAILSGVAGYWIGVGKISRNIPELFTRAFTNIENYVIIISLVMLVISFILTNSVTESAGNAFAIILLNVFSTIIFSWLLTKKSTGRDFKEREEEQALKSYRHINYIESAANSASKIIDKYSQEQNLSSETRLILSSANDKIRYIQGGINTCKMDWFDLLSDAEKEKRLNEQHSTEDYGTVDAVLSNVDINQEDA